MKQQIFVTVLLLITAMIVGCESEPNPDQSLSPAAFDLVCQGTGLTQAAPYTPDDGRNQAIVMSDSTIGAQYDQYNTRYNREMPEEWFPQVVDGTFNYSAVELVLCISRTAAEPVDVACDFEDGYSINVHNATYELVLRTASTAEIVAQESVTNDGRCPTMFSLFTEGEKNVDQFADVDDSQIEALIEPYVQ